ncbi:MAG: alpha-L-arabinofuranosidase C-terminal domain-containing protein [Candidatus Fervidibacter sacchari]
MWNLVKALLIGGLMAMQGWTDEFDGAQLNGRWRWHAPAGGSYALQDGWLVLSAPQREKGFNHWSGVFDAPMLLTDLPDGDWAAETTLHLSDFASDGDFHIGMAIAVSERYLWLWGIFYSATTWKMTKPELWLERTGEARLLQVPLETRTVQLRAEKRGMWLHFFWRHNERMPWQEAGKSLAWFTPKQIGLIVKTWGNGRPLTARFDHFRLEAMPAKDEPIKVSVRVNPQKRLNEISPLIYGQFIEHLGRCIYGGIWAEMLRNRKMHGSVQENGVVENWQPFGKNARWFADNVEFFVGGQSQVIEGTGSGEHGIAQSGLDLLPKGYVGRVIVKGEGVNEITVSLRKDGKVLASKTLKGVTNRWKKLPFRLQVKGAVSDAHFVIAFSGKGKLWVGVTSLMPADNVDGMRKDVLDAIKDIKPPIVRWPGGNFVSGYDWRDGIGDPDKRPPRWDRAWGAWEWNDFGTDEFMKFCRYIGAEPYICTNAGEGYEHEAAEWMRYCKEKGYKVRYWGIGNEMYGNWQLGHLDANKYALKAILFATEMRKVIPDARLVAVGVDGSGWGNWNAIVTRIAGAHFDLIAPHYYQGYNPNDDPRQIYTVVVGSPVRIERMLRETFDIVERNKPKGKRITLAFDEWNVWEPHQTQSAGFESFYALRDGIFAAGVFHAMHRCGDFVELACLAQTVNVLGAIRTTQTQVLKTPIYWAFWLYVRNTGKWRVACDVDSPVGTTPVGGETPVVDASATLSEDGKTLFIGLINRHPESDIEVQLDLGNFKAKPTVQMWQLWSENFTDTNTFEQPEKVRPTERTIPLNEALTLKLPRHSVTVLKFER